MGFKFYLLHKILIYNKEIFGNCTIIVLLNVTVRGEDMARSINEMEKMQQTKSTPQKIGELLVRLSLGYQKVPDLKPAFGDSTINPAHSRLGFVNYKKTKLVLKNNKDMDLGLTLTFAAANALQYGCVKNMTRDKKASLIKTVDGGIPVMNRLAFLCTAMAGAVPEKVKAESSGYILFAYRASCFVANLVTLRAPCLLLSRSLETVSAYVNLRCYELCEKSVGMVQDNYDGAAYGPMMMGALGALLGGVTYAASTIIHLITRIVSNVMDFIYNPIETAQHLAKTVDKIMYSVPDNPSRIDAYVPTTTSPFFKIAAVSLAACVAIAVCVIVPPVLLAVAPNVIAPVAAVVTPVVSAALHTTVSSWAAMAIAGGSLPVLSTLLSGLAKLGSSFRSKLEASSDKEEESLSGEDKKNLSDPLIQNPMSGANRQS